MTELSQHLGRRATLDDIPTAALEALAAKGFDWIWLLSVWQTGVVAQEVSRTNPQWRHDFEETLPDLTNDDIAGSGFAITAYKVHQDLGGDSAVARLRGRLRRLGMNLMLDFVCNHMAIDHPWVHEHPDYLVRGIEEDLTRTPLNYFRSPSEDAAQIFAYGRDPYFAGWADTVQLNYGNPELQQAMIGELSRIANQCDGLRCDMAMLVLPEVFLRTWGIEAQPFWPAAIQRVRSDHPSFVFMAEVYWDLEWTLQQQGFNYCYDKRLYDRLHSGDAKLVRSHLRADPEYQDRLARFLENHDEPRAATVFPLDQHRAAAIITFLSPGMRFLHEGQLDGRLKKISPHLARAPQETTNAELARFYKQLLRVLRLPTVRDGRWWLLECRPAWDGNWTNDDVIAFAWERSATERLIVVVNYSGHQSQSRIPLPFANLMGNVHLQDLIGTQSYDRGGGDLVANGLYVDLPGWGSHVFAVVTTR
jgi:glycosidase